MRADPINWMNDWTEDNEIGLDGRFSLDQLRALVMARDKALGLDTGDHDIDAQKIRQETARVCAGMIRDSCAYTDWIESGQSVADDIEREFGLKKRSGA